MWLHTHSYKLSACEVIQLMCCWPASVHVLCTLHAASGWSSHANSNGMNDSIVLLKMKSNGIGHSNSHVTRGYNHVTCVIYFHVDWEYFSFRYYINACTVYSECLDLGFTSEIK